MPRRNKYYFFLILFILISLFPATSRWRASASLAPKFYYFNPSSALTNLASLKLEMDILLQKIGFPLTFNPFSKFNDFDRVTKEQMPEFVLLPKWYYEKNGKNLQLEPFLVATRQGTTFYQKVLLTSKQSDINLKTLDKRTLAMTTMGPDGETVLNSILFSRYNLDIRDINIVLTPKDSDALFALVLQQVEVALVGKETVKKIGELNPRVIEKVRVLAETSEIPMPVICYRKGAATLEQIEELNQLFLGVDKNSSKLMEMLQIDGWKTYTK